MPTHSTLRTICNYLSFPRSSLSSPSTFLPLTTPFSIFLTIFHSQNPSLFSTLCSSHPLAAISSNLGSQCLSPSTRSCFCSYPYSFYRGRAYATSNQVSEIVAIIRDGANDLGRRLNAMNLSLSTASIVRVLKVLSSERVSALGFFYWIKASHPELCCSPEIGMLVVNNCGLLGSFEAMVPILNELNLERVRLRRDAFEFFQVLGMEHGASTVERVGKMVDVLNEVGGLCQSSGLELLIEMFGVLGSFDIAEYVIGRNNKSKVNHYNILIRIMCQRGDCERAGDLVKEMKRSGCHPSKTTYNLLIGCLCKNGKLEEAFRMLETMENDGDIPDASNFSIPINLL